MRKQKGFSLIELLIVVAIILIIAAIAIPNLLRSRIAANEASAVGSIRTLNTAEVTYASTYPDVGFNVLANLGGAGGSATGAGLIDAVLASAVKSGYVVRDRHRPEPPAPVRRPPTRCRATRRTRRPVSGTSTATSRA